MKSVKKGGIDKARILNDPNFQRTRENMSESITIERFNPQVLLLNGATHMQFVLAAARITQDDVFPRPVLRTSHCICVRCNRISRYVLVTTEDELGVG